MIVFREPGRNLSAPADDGGWRYCGDWGAFCAVAISPRHFLTARHCGGFPGQYFVFHGERFRATARFLVGDADLAVWQVDRPMPTWAMLAVSDSESGAARVIGRGLPRGVALHRNNRPIGWRWGVSDGRRSWGVCCVDGIVNDPETGPQLHFSFDRRLGVDAGSVAPGDSGGGVFVQRGADWALMGITRAVERDWSSGADGRGAFSGSLYDCAGLFRPGPDNQGWRKSPEPEPCIGGWTATRITAHRERLLQIINGPLFPDLLPAVAGAALLLIIAGAAGIVRRRKRQSATPRKYRAGRLRAPSSPA